MPFAVCKMCLQEKNLVSSHLWCVTKLATFEKTFPLYDLVSANPPVCSVDKTDIFFVRTLPTVKVKKLVHFGMGMFFKAAVHGWQKGRTEPRINLDPYTEPLRLWFRGEGNFPSDMYLVVQIAPPDRAQIGLFPPYEAEHRVFYVYVPGLLFMLNTGPDTDPKRKPLCLWNNPDRPILSSGAGGPPFAENISEWSFGGCPTLCAFCKGWVTGNITRLISQLHVPRGVSRPTLLYRTRKSGALSKFAGKVGEAAKGSAGYPLRQLC